MIAVVILVIRFAVIVIWFHLSDYKQCKLTVNMPSNNKRESVKVRLSRNGLLFMVRLFFLFLNRLIYNLLFWRLLLLLHLLLLLRILLLELPFLVLLLRLLSLQLLQELLLEVGLKGWLIEPPLDPHSIHLQSCFPILQQLAVQGYLHLLEPGLGAESLQLLLLEVVNANPVVFAVEIVPELAVALAGEVELSEVVPSVVSEEQEASRFHSFAYLQHDLCVFFWSNGREDKYHGVEIAGELVGYLIFDKVADAYMHAWLEVGVFVHLLFYEVDGLRGDVAAVVVEAVELPQEWEERVADTAAEFVVVADDPEFLLAFFEVCDFWHLSFEVGAIFEEVAFVGLVELVPDFLPAGGHPEVILL